MKSSSWHSRAPTRQRIHDAFAAMTSNQEEDDCDDGIVNHDEIISPLLRRGRRITDDTRSSE